MTQRIENSITGKYAVLFFNKFSRCFMHWIFGLMNVSIDVNAEKVIWIWNSDEWKNPYSGSDW